MQADSMFGRPPVEVAPGAVHTPDWLTWTTSARGRRVPGVGRSPGRHAAHALPNGGVMSVQTVCLGWHWTRTATRAPSPRTAPR